MIRLWNSLGLWGRFLLVVVTMGTLAGLLWRYVVLPILTAIATWAVEEVVEAVTGDDEEEEEGDGNGEEENGDEPDPDGVQGNGGGQLPFDSSLVFVGRAELLNRLDPGSTNRRKEK